MKYFEKIETLEELKKEYNKQVRKLHPDLNKDKDTTSAFQEMQNEYEEKFEQVKNKHKNASGETYEKETHEDFGEFADIINNLVHYDGVNIEIIGAWIWLTGNTKTYAKEIKEMGFRWSVNKFAWYYHKGEYHKKSKTNYNMDELREKWGTQKVENETQKKLA